MALMEKKLTGSNADNSIFCQFVDFTHIINSELKLNKILQRAADNICLMLGAMGCHIMLFQNIREELSLATGAASGPKLPDNLNEIINRHYELTNVDQKTLRKPMIIRDSGKDPRIIKELAEYLGHRSLLRVPIISGYEVIGAISIYSKELNYFDDEKVNFMILLSNQLGITINNARLIKQLETEKELLHKLNEKEKELEQANYLLKLEEQIRQNEKFAVVGKLAAGLAHEIRNPITSIKGFLQLIQQKTVEETTREYLTIVLDDLERISGLVTDFLLLSKPSAPKFAVYKTNDILKEVLEIMKSNAMENDIYVKEDLDDKLPEIYVDKEQFKQVIINIIRNSIEAINGKGEIIISTQLLPEEGMVRTTIIDNGPGISRDVLARIFDPFYTTKEEGTGLGLSVSYRIIENLLGRISIESEEGKGTVTYIDIPVNEAKDLMDSYN